MINPFHNGEAVAVTAQKKDQVLDRYAQAYNGQSVYDFDNQIMLNWYARRITELADPGATVLELGLGHGFSARVFAAHFREYSIIEGSALVIEQFHRNFPENPARIMAGFFETFDSPQRFDLIIMGFVLEHVADPVGLLKYYRRFLSTQGRLFAAVPNAEAMNRRLGLSAGLLDDLQTLSEHDRQLGHLRYYSTETLRADLEQAGYKIRRMEGIYLKPLTTAQMISLQLDEKIINGLCQLGLSYPELSCSLLAEAELR